MSTCEFVSATFFHITINITMAHHVEPMDIDNIESEFDNKENTYHHSNVLPRTPCTEKGYEELDVSELNMKLRYSMTPTASPMSKSMSHCVDNRYSASPDKSMDKTVVNENNLTRSLNSSLNKSDLKSSKTVPLQALPADLVDSNRNSTILQPLETTVAPNDITITISNENEIDNMSFPSSSSSLAHTPEATTPTKEIPKRDGGSPIMRGLKSVLSMFRSSQSPIPSSEADTKIVDQPIPELMPQATASTPVNHKRNEKSLPRKSSPHKESIVFNEDLEKELQWTDDSTIVFSTEKIPIHKLFFQDKSSSSKLDKVSKPEKEEDVNSSVEYMDISYNDLSIQDKTLNGTVKKNKVDDILESDGEFVDCETTFTEDAPQDNTEENNGNKDDVIINEPKNNAVYMMDTTKDIIKLLDSSEIVLDIGETTRQLDFSTTDIVNRLSELIDASETVEVDVTEKESNTSKLIKKSENVVELRLLENQDTSPENAVNSDNTTPVKIAENVSVLNDIVNDLGNIISDTLETQVDHVIPKLSSVPVETITVMPPDIVSQTLRQNQEVISIKTPEIRSLVSNPNKSHPGEGSTTCIVSPADIPLPNEDTLNEIIKELPKENKFTESQGTSQKPEIEMRANIIEDTITNIPCPSSLLSSDVSLPHSDDNRHAKTNITHETITAAHDSVPLQISESTAVISISHNLQSDSQNTVQILQKEESGLIEAIRKENNADVPTSHDVVLPEKDIYSQNNIDQAPINKNDFVEETIQTTEIPISNADLKSRLQCNIQLPSSNENTLKEITIDKENTEKSISSDVVEPEKEDLRYNSQINIQLSSPSENTFNEAIFKNDAFENPISTELIQTHKDLTPGSQDNVHLPSSNENAVIEASIINRNISDVIQSEEKDFKSCSQNNIQLPPPSENLFNETVVKNDITEISTCDGKIQHEKEDLKSNSQNGIQLKPTIENTLNETIVKNDIIEIPIGEGIIQHEKENLKPSPQNNIQLLTPSENPSNETIVINDITEIPIGDSKIQHEQEDLKSNSLNSIQLQPPSENPVNETIHKNDITEISIGDCITQHEKEDLKSNFQNIIQLQPTSEHTFKETMVKNDITEIPIGEGIIQHEKEDLKSSSQNNIQLATPNSNPFNEAIVKTDITNIPIGDGKIQHEKENLESISQNNVQLPLPPPLENNFSDAIVKDACTILESKEENMEVSFCEQTSEKVPESVAMDVSVIHSSFSVDPEITTKAGVSDRFAFESPEIAVQSVKSTTECTNVSLQSENKEVLKLLSKSTNDTELPINDTPKESEELRTEVNTKDTPMNTRVGDEPLMYPNSLDPITSPVVGMPSSLNPPKVSSIKDTIERKEDEVVETVDVPDKSSSVYHLKTLETTPKQDQLGGNISFNSSTLAKNSSDDKSNDVFIEATTITKKLGTTDILTTADNINKHTQLQNNPDEEIVLSENNSPFVSVSVDEEFEPETKKEDFVEIENPFDNKCKIVKTPPTSPKIVSKGYNFNFDDIDNINPFATKTKIRMSPPPGASLNPSLDAGNSYYRKKEPLLNKDKTVNQRKSMPERRKPLKVNRNINSTFDGGSSIPPKQTLKVDEQKDTLEADVACAKQESQRLSVCVQPDVAVDTPLQKDALTLEGVKLNEIDQIKDALIPNIDDSNNKMSTQAKEIDSFPDNGFKMVEDVVTDSLKSSVKPDDTSSSEQSTYFSAGTSSTEGSESKSVFNLPEIDDQNFNPFATKSKIRQTPPPDLDIIDPFATKSKIKSSPETSFILTNKEPHSKVSATSDGELNDSRSSSRSSDGKDNTVQEIHTEDEDTIEGPFIEAEDDSDDDKLSKFDDGKGDMVDFSNKAQVNEEDTEAAEMFIDAEAFEFLMNQNKTDEVTYSGKESLFLKFDPLFARRVTSEGVAAALNEYKRRQNTPVKTPKQPQEEILSFEAPIAGPSEVISTREVPSVENENHEDMNVTISKPMMVVTPAVNSVVTPKKSLTPNRTNRLSMTFTSPAMAVIDRLLSLSGNSPSAGLDATVSPVSRERNEADQALTQLRELLAEKELNVYNLRCESKELKSRLSTLETQMKSLETESAERLKKIDELTENLAEKTKMNRSMAAVVEEYERTIASLISETEQDKKRYAEERNQLIRERDEQTAHLTSMEVSFSDLHSKYEKSKQVIIGYKANENVYKNSIKEFEDNLAKMQANYELLKQHATSKLNHANQELEKLNKAHEAEMLKLNAMIKRKDLHITSLEESLAQKTKANEELTAICDELINKVA